MKMCPFRTSGMGNLQIPAFYMATTFGPSTYMNYKMDVRQLVSNTKLHLLKFEELDV
ncbi:hypothetical protein F511_32547 [Dorcoceras hygrometricum]|uniref:Uncharacterized protein n=1 Tax=Dorcoceras hygrometricum TaxID=472368 RepID=A0A2Z7C2H8_9LAMI|nr:hypothetical protein F511_32547 [Dorcoceras hygrometricum]